MKSKAIVGFFLIILLAMAGYIAWQNYQVQEGFVEESIEPIPELLRTADEDPTTYKREIFRLAGEANYAALGTAVKLLEHSNPLVRSVSAEAIGFYPDSEYVLEYLKQSIKDPDRTARIGAIRGLSRNLTEKRRTIVLELLEDRDTPITEKVELFSALGRTDDTESKQAAIEWLLYLGNQSNENVNFTAISRAANISPTDPRVVQTLHRKLDEKAHMGEMKLAIQHLAAIKDPEFIDKLPRLLQSTEPDVRTAAVLAFPKICEQGSWQKLTSLFKTESNERARMAIVQAALEMKGPKGTDFLNQAFASGRLPSQFVDEYQVKLDDMAKNRYNGSCEK